MILESTGSPILSSFFTKKRTKRGQKEGGGNSRRSYELRVARHSISERKRERERETARVSELKRNVSYRILLDQFHRNQRENYSDRARLFLLLGQRNREIIKETQEDRNRRRERE